MKKVKEKLRKDPLKSNRPELPVTGPGKEIYTNHCSLLMHAIRQEIDLEWCFFFLSGKGGRITSGMSLSAFVVKNIALQKADDSHPREAILKHAEVCYFVIY